MVSYSPNIIFNKQSALIECLPVFVWDPLKRSLTEMFMN